MCAPNIVDRCPPETSSAKQDAGNGGKVRPRGVFAASDNHPRDRTGRRIIELCLQVVLFEDFLYFCGREINTDNLKIFIYGI